MNKIIKKKINLKALNKKIKHFSTPPPLYRLITQKKYSYIKKIQLKKIKPNNKKG